MLKKHNIAFFCQLGSVLIIVLTTSDAAHRAYKRANEEKLLKKIK